MAKVEADRAEASALLERRMAAMEAVLAARRTTVQPPAEPAAARGPGADLRFSVRLQHSTDAVLAGLQHCLIE